MISFIPTPNSSVTSADVVIVLFYDRVRDSLHTLTDNTVPRLDKQRIKNLRLMKIAFGAWRIGSLF